MTNERITGDMNVQQMIMEMCDGNPGAINVLFQIMQKGEQIDTDAGPIGGLGIVMSMYTLGIYGLRIWGLYKDVCGEDLAKTMLRAWQMGQLAGVTKEKLLYAIDNRGAGLDIDAAVAAVKERLPGFNTELAT